MSIGGIGPVGGFGFRNYGFGEVKPPPSEPGKPTEGSLNPYEDPDYFYKLLFVIDRNAYSKSGKKLKPNWFG